jgi:hypothetical protein
MTVMAIRRLAADYGMEYGVLSEKLPNIWRGTSIARETLKNEPTTKIAREHVGEIRNAAAALRKQISTVPKDSSFHAELEYRYGPDGGRRGLSTLVADLKELTAVLGDLDPAGWKQRGEQAYREALVNLLAQLWEHQKGEAANSSDRSDMFLAFMARCAGIFDIDPDPLPATFARLRRERRKASLNI